MPAFQQLRPVPPLSVLAVQGEATRQQIEEFLANQAYFRRLKFVEGELTKVFVLVKANELHRDQLQKKLDLAQQERDRLLKALEKLEAKRGAGIPEFSESKKSEVSGKTSGVAISIEELKTRILEMGVKIRLYQSQLKALRTTLQAIETEREQLIISTDIQLGTLEQQYKQALRDVFTQAVSDKNDLVQQRPLDPNLDRELEDVLHVLFSDMEKMDVVEEMKEFNQAPESSRKILQKAAQDAVQKHIPDAAPKLQVAMSGVRRPEDIVAEEKEDLPSLRDLFMPMVLALHAVRVMQVRAVQVDENRLIHQVVGVGVQSCVEVHQCRLGMGSALKSIQEKLEERQKEMEAFDVLLQKMRREQEEQQKEQEELLRRLGAAPRPW